MTEQILARRRARRIRCATSSCATSTSPAPTRPGALGPAAPGATHLLKVACEAALGRRAACRCSATTTRPAMAPACATSSTSATSPTPISRRSSTCWAVAPAARSTAAMAAASRCARCSTWWPGSAAGRWRSSARRARPGDPVEVIAAAAGSGTLLGWQPRYDDLEQIVRDALRFERRLPEASHMSGNTSYVVVRAQREPEIRCPRTFALRDAPGLVRTTPWVRRW